MSPGQFWPNILLADKVSIGTEVTTDLFPWI